MRNTLIAALLLICSFLLFNFALPRESKTYTIVNKSGMVITSVYFAPSGTDNWSDNVNTGLPKLGNNEGFQYDIDVAKDNCNYDFKYKTEQGNDITLKNVSLCANAVVQLISPTTN